MAGGHDCSFAGSLPHFLHAGTRLRVYHVSTPATLHEPIFASLPEQPEELTTCESHFLGITQISDRGSEVSARSPEILVLGIEVLIFTTPSLSTIFVSKADSTGFLVRHSSTSKTAAPTGTPHTTTLSSSTIENSSSGRTSGSSQSSNTNNKVSSSTAQVVITAFLLYLVNAHLSQHANTRLVLSLFARSQSQYLFPGSVENSSKHVLDDRQLIKWWCKVLDPLLKPDPSHRVFGSVLRAPEPVSSQQNLHDVQHGQVSKSCLTALTGATAYILVPGCDRSEIWRSFLPASVKVSAPSKLPDPESKWRVSFPIDELRPNRAVAAITSAVASADVVVQNNRRDLGSNDVTLTDLPVQCLIPRLPDDPKARFCDDLDASVDAQGRWRSVKTLAEFWELMGYRQECSAGRVVGFIWVVFGAHAKDSGEPRHGGRPRPDQDSGISTSKAEPSSLALPETTDTDSEVSRRAHHGTTSNVGGVVSTFCDATETVTERMTEKPESVNAFPSSQNPPELSPLSTTRTGSILLTKEAYETFSAYLINDLDFAGVDQGIESTASWIQKLCDLSGQQEVGTNVDGSAKPTTLLSQRDADVLPTAEAGPDPSLAGSQVNVLTAIRKKKRKALEFEGDK